LAICKQIEGGERESQGVGEKHPSKKKKVKTKKPKKKQKKPKQKKGNGNKLRRFLRKRQKGHGMGGQRRGDAKKNG